MVFAKCAPKKKRCNFGKPTLWDQKNAAGLV
jgi:hypothetical protein